MKTICIIGLGYVGLPLALEFSKYRPVLGYDVNKERIDQLNSGEDSTLECERDDLLKADKLTFTNSLNDLHDCGIFIITVPTPINEKNEPDLSFLIRASESVGLLLKKDDIVIYESTVYPGATEEVCVPILEKNSGFIYNKDFFCGYSPERINPGDKSRRLSDIIKVTSGSTPEVASEIDKLYSMIVSAGTHKTSSIRVAEAAKVIENTQRDLNIALINELSLIFKKIGIDTYEVLEAAGTKWNFQKFQPGLVGGHCIGVDPYYLTYKARELGYNPEIILAGRRLNDMMAAHISNELISLMLVRKIPVLNSKVLILGLSFKENCPDVRNTKVVDIVRTLRERNVFVDIYDPWVPLQTAKSELGIVCLSEKPEEGTYAAVIVAVAHDQFLELGAKAIKAFGQPGAVIYDVKGILPKEGSDARL